MFSCCYSEFILFDTSSTSNCEENKLTLQQEPLIIGIIIIIIIIFC